MVLQKGGFGQGVGLMPYLGRLGGGEAFVGEGGGGLMSYTQNHHTLDIRGSIYTDVCDFLLTKSHPDVSQIPHVHRDATYSILGYIPGPLNGIQKI